MANKRATPIRPQHFSVRGKAIKLKPRGMTELRGVPTEKVAAMECLAIDIFTEMVNSGKTFQESLAAIYLSGLENGYAATMEMQNESKIHHPTRTHR